MAPSQPESAVPVSRDLADTTPQARRTGFPGVSSACGRRGKDPAEGFATIGDTRYCHGDGDPAMPKGLQVPTCYELTGIGTEWTGPMFYDSTVTSKETR